MRAMRTTDGTRQRSAWACENPPVEMRRVGVGAAPGRWQLVVQETADGSRPPGRNENRRCPTEDPATVRFARRFPARSSNSSHSLPTRPRSTPRRSIRCTDRATSTISARPGPSSGDSIRPFDRPDAQQTSESLSAASIFVPMGWGIRSRRSSRFAPSFLGGTSAPRSFTCCRASAPSQVTRLGARAHGDRMPSR